MSVKKNGLGMFNDLPGRIDILKVMFNVEIS